MLGRGYKPRGHVSQTAHRSELLQRGQQQARSMIYDVRGSETHTTLFKTQPYGICPATTRKQPLACGWMAPLTCLVRHTMPLAEYTVSRGAGHTPQSDESDTRR